MNVSLTSIATNTYKKGSVFAGGLPVLQNNGLKSTQEKAERQQKAQNEVAFQENLKTKECDSVEEIAEKLKALHSYEDEIAAAKESFNNEQMWHIMDEAEEIGEKIAEAAEKMEPKTPEERKEEAVEEALETEEDKGVLEDMLDEVVEASEDVTDLTEELAEMEEETEKQKENLEQTENLTEESQDVPKGKGALAKLSEEIQEIEEEKQQAVEEEKLAARQARNLEAYQTVDRRYRYQAMDLKV